ncbi:LacI family DNA-binding transcriptional regulator [Psychromarinibacter sp. C21-152]|uniref:LacI family DNA-binding transcriptional regulator n=1 Tax=Psychromarinibacter sediminicola TaxID=3033385 RepID=A0AAE3NSG0_9RHOB|nr:LacI family DNA-binding transcriptional regulator [Psychromarinibacter sediminicola]MDF0599717.1 LacI family DNA-binding transcriptional regulator [Psychromarinibacter sediminicola]
MAVDGIHTKRDRETVTLKQVAERAGVGIMTVSRVINTPEAVSDKLKARVNEAVRELGYVPNRYAGSLASARTSLVTVIVPSLSGRVFGEIIKGADEILSPRGYQIMVSNTAYSLEDEELVCRRVLGWRPEGVIISGIDHTEGTRRLLLDAEIPVVEALELGGNPIDINIGLSHRDAGRAAVDHLLERGYRQLSFIGAQMQIDFRAQRRRQGFLDGLAAAGLQAVHDISFDGKVAFEAGAAAFAQLQDTGEATDAVFCVSDELAIGVLGEAQRRGLRVPQDLAIIGFNDLDVSSAVMPALTTIRSPRKQMGRLAAQALLGDGDLAKKIDVGFELIPRGST